MRVISCSCRNISVKLSWRPGSHRQLCPLLILAIPPQEDTFVITYFRNHYKGISCVGNPGLATLIPCDGLCSSLLSASASSHSDSKMAAHFGPEIPPEKYQRKRRHPCLYLSRNTQEISSSVSQAWITLYSLCWISLGFGLAMQLSDWTETWLTYETTCRTWELPW